MAERDYIGRLLQILRIKSPEDVPVSGAINIQVETKLQYSELFPIVDDGDVVYKAYIDENVNVDPLEFDQSNLLGTSGNYYLEFTPTTGFRPLMTYVIYADGSEVSNPFVYTKPANPSLVYTQYGFPDNSAQTVKIYQVKA